MLLELDIDHGYCCGSPQSCCCISADVTDLEVEIFALVADNWTIVVSDGTVTADKEAVAALEGAEAATVDRTALATEGLVTGIVVLGDKVAMEWRLILLCEMILRVFNNGGCLIELEKAMPRLKGTLINKTDK